MGNPPSDDYYALLGVEADADPGRLRRVWRRLALRWHPDRAGPQATARFQKISVAYAVLSDPVARAAYDRRRGATREDGMRDRSSPLHRSESDRTAAQPGPRRRAPGVMLSRLSGPLNALLTCGVARRADGDVIELFLKAEEAAQGGMASISMRVPVHCRSCGAGEASCPRCEGQGTVEELFSAWLAVPPGVLEGAMLAPSALLPGMLRPVCFRIRVRARR